MTTPMPSDQGAGPDPAPNRVGEAAREAQPVGVSTPQTAAPRRGDGRDDPEPAPAESVIPESSRSPGSRVLDFLAGLPALAAAGALAFALYQGTRLPLAASYDAEANRRVMKRDLPGALVCFKRLLELAPDRPDYRWKLAVLLGESGQVDRAESVLRPIAPTDRTGFPEAHLWIARRIASDPNQLRARSALAEGHLLRYLQAAPPNSVMTKNAKSILGKLYADTGRPGEARPLLEATAGEQPELLLDLAHVCQALGDREPALSHARTAQKVARSRSEARPDDKASRFLWAQACIVLEDYRGAIEVLNQGDRLTHDPNFRKAMAETCAAWARNLAKDKKSKPGDVLQVIQEGLRFDDTNRNLLDMTAGYLLGDGAEAEALRSALVSGAALGLNHFVLGNRAWSQGKVDEARQHWEQAYRFDPKTPTIANNLAYVLAYREPADPPRALALIDQALTPPFNPADLPSLGKFRGTRGQILVKMGRWKEAVTDLELALSSGENTSGIHEGLAQAYEQLGIPEMAAEHRKLVKP